MTYPRRPLPAHLIGDGEAARRGITPARLDAIRAAHTAHRATVTADQWLAARRVPVPPGRPVALVDRREGMHVTSLAGTPLPPVPPA